jgi:TP901 family phage tail tape measure protein
LKIGDVFLGVGADLRDFDAALAKLPEHVSRTATQMGQQMAKFGSSTSRVGQSLTTNLTLPIVAVGGAAVKMGLDFDTSLRRIVALAGVSKDEIGGIRESLLKLGPEIGKSPQELADAFYFVASAGFKADEAMKVITAAAKASASGMGSTSDVARVLGGAINAYGHENLSAARAADILTKAVTLGSAEAADFANQLGTVIPGAAALGVSLDQVTAAMTGMTNVGISAAEAATSLTQIFSALQKPTAEAENAMADLGLSSAGLRTELREKGLLATLRTLQDSFGGNEVAAAKVFGNIRALRGVTALLTQDTGKLNDIFKQVADSQGAAAQAYLDTEGPQRELEKSLADLQATAISLGNDVLPMVVDVARELAGAARELSKWWKSLDVDTKKTIVQWAAYLAIAGPVLMVTGKLISAFGALFKIVGWLTGTKGLTSLIRLIPFVGTAAASALGPLAALAAALLLIKQAQEGFNNAMAGGDPQKQQALEILDGRRSLWDGITALDAKGLKETQDRARASAEMVAAGITGSLAGTSEAIDKAMGDAVASIDVGGGQMLKVFEDGTTALEDSSTATADEIAKAFEEAKQRAVESMRTMLDNMENVLADGPSQIQDEMQKLVDALVDPYTEVERQLDLETALAMKAVRDTLKSEDPKIAADAFEQANNWLKQYDILEPGMLERGKLLNPALKSGVQSNVQALLDFARDNVAGEYMKEFGVPLSDALEALGYASLAAFQRGIEHANDIKFWSTVATGVRGAMNIDLEPQGRAAGDSFRRGFNSTLSQALADFYYYASVLRNVMPSSEPKDPNSPWRGITKIGASAAMSIIEGWRSTLPAFQQVLGQWGGLPMQPAFAGMASAPASGLAASVGAKTVENHWHLTIGGVEKTFRTRDDFMRALDDLSTFAGDGRQA